MLPSLQNRTKKKKERAEIADKLREIIRQGCEIRGITMVHGNIVEVIFIFIFIC
jgi:hypothetical protein